MQTEETRALIKTYYETLPTGNREKLAPKNKLPVLGFDSQIAISHDGDGIIGGADHNAIFAATIFNFDFGVILIIV